MANIPINQGYHIPPIAPTVSAAAAFVRMAAIAAAPGTYTLPITPRRVINQNDLPCCVSCALTSAMEALDSATPVLSPLFHYFVTRYDNGGANAEGFLDLDAGLTTVTDQGICSDGLHSPPFTIAGASTKPSVDAYADALARALGLRGLTSRYNSLLPATSLVTSIRAELTQNRPVILEIQLPVGYRNSFLNPRFEWTDPNAPRSLSAHCVLAIGYDDGRTCIRIQDSCGSSLFDGGFWWMGYSIVDSSVVWNAISLIP